VKMFCTHLRQNYDNHHYTYTYNGIAEQTAMN